MAEPSGPADPAARIAAGYAATGPAVELGAVVLDGRPHPGAQVRVPLAMLNRHGLIAGATGTGKTKTLQLMAEQLSAAGVPVVLADLKGDLAGLARPGAERRPGPRSAPPPPATPGRRPASRSSTWPSAAWAPASRCARRSPTSARCCSRGCSTSTPPRRAPSGLVFHHADAAGLPLLDLADLRAVLTWLTSKEGKADLEGLGGLSKATAGVILRELIGLADLGGDVFFGEPAFYPADLLRTAADGRGVISAVELPAIQDRPALFSTFLMWLLAELFEDLPEVGDLDRPKLVFFLDEAHLLFTGASKAFLEAVTQTVRLIRSKGVGVFFVTQNPTDVPRPVLAQLGNRVQHALRTFTPEDADALAKTVKTFPRSEDYDVATLLTSLGTGEAAVTVLTERGAPDPRGVDDAAGPAVAHGHRRGRRPGRRRRRLTPAGPLRRRRRPASRPARCWPPAWHRRRPRAGARPRGPAAAAQPVAGDGAAGPAAAAAPGAARRRPARRGAGLLRPVRGVGAGPGDHPRAVRHPAPPALSGGPRRAGTAVRR